MYGKNNELYRICIDCESMTWLHLYNIAVLLESLDLIHRVEIHFALWRLHKNTIFKSHSNACIE